MRRAGLMIVAAAACACGSGASIRDIAVRDSAGVTIVENPAVAPDLRWEVLGGPAIDIGGADAPETHSLFRVAGAVRLSDGRIVVANGGSAELRYFAPDGTYLRAVGGRGEGPGEFEQLTWLHRLAGDSIITYDVRHLRLSVFDAAGRFVRSLRLQTSDAVPFGSVIGMFADRSLLAQGFAQTGGEVPNGLQRFPASLYRFGSDGSFSTDLGTFPGNETFFESHADGGFSFDDAFFPRYTYRIAAGAYLYVAANDTYAIQQLSPDGALLRIVRRAHRPVPVTAAQARAERERRLAAARPDGRERLAGVLSRMPVPETYPAYHLVRASDAGEIWVQTYPVERSAGARWAVYDSTGVLVEELDLPAGLDPSHIGEGFVLGRWRDELDIEHVRLYPLIKP